MRCIDLASSSRGNTRRRSCRWRTSWTSASSSCHLPSCCWPRKWSFPIILIPTIGLFLLADITQAVALASRVFAAYFLIQAFIAGTLARRAKNWGAVAGFVAVGFAMATIMIFGVSI